MERKENEGVVKSGVLVKVKTNRKKWFVLRNLNSGFSKLEYYDDYKKFSNGARPKRIIDLDDCFNISKKSDRKNKNCIMMFTKEDCFLIACESDEEASDWLSKMWELQNKDSTNKRENFEHIWPTTLMKKGLGSTKVIIPGSYRLCLSSAQLILFKTSDTEQKSSFTFSIIRRVGHRQNVFFFEVGRSASTGAGELYLQMEHEDIAELVHCAVVNHMKNTSFSLTDGQIASSSSPFRNRSHSSAADRKKNFTTSESNKDSGSTYRNKTMSTSSIMRSNNQSCDIEPHKMSSRTRPSSSRHTATFGASSLAAAGLVDLTTADHLSYSCSANALSSMNSAAPTSGSTLGHAHSPMSTSPMVSTCLGETYPPQAGLEGHNKDEGSYLSMTTNPPSNNTLDYFDMSPGYHEPSPDLTSTGSEYFDMKPTSLATVQEKLQNEQAYANMTGHNTNSDRFPSYADDILCEEFPKRAYSVGSKASALASRLRNKIDDSHKCYSNRASSSEGLSDYNKSSSAPHLPCDSPTSSNRDSTLFMEVDFNREPQPCIQYLNRPRSHSHGHKEMKQRALNFNRSLNSSLLKGEDNPVLVSTVTHSNGTIPRQRTRTISQDNIHPRTSSFSNEIMRPRSSSSGQNSMQRPYLNKSNVCENEYIDATSSTVSNHASFIENKALPRQTSLIGSFTTSSENLQTSPGNPSDYMVFVPSKQVANQKIHVINDCLPTTESPPQMSALLANKNIYINVENKAPTRPIPNPPVQIDSKPPLNKSIPPANKSIPPSNKTTPQPNKTQPTGNKSTPTVSKSTQLPNKPTPPINKATPSPHPSNVPSNKPSPLPNNSRLKNSINHVSSVSQHSTIPQQSQQPSYAILHPIQEPMDPYSIIEDPQYCVNYTSSKQGIRPQHHVRRPTLMNCELDCSADGEAIDSIFVASSNCCRDSDPFNLGATPTSKPPTRSTTHNTSSPMQTLPSSNYNSHKNSNNHDNFQPTLTSSNYNPHAYQVDQRNLSNMTPSERLVFEEEGVKLKNQLYDLQLNYAQLELASESSLPSSPTSQSSATNSASITQVINNELLPGYTQIDFSESPQRHLKTGC